MPASLVDGRRGRAARISRIPRNVVADLTISIATLNNKMIMSHAICQVLATYQVSLFEFWKHLSYSLRCQTLMS